MEGDNIFDELEDFLNDAVPANNSNQNESSHATTLIANTPGQQSNTNQFNPGAVRGAGGNSTPSMMGNGYNAPGCKPTTKAVLGERIGERLRNQLGGRGEHPINNADLKRKLDEGIGGPNDPIYNKAPKLEIKDEAQSPHGNSMIKTEIKEEHSNSQLEAILGLNGPSSGPKYKSDINLNGGGGDVKSEYASIPQKPPPTQGGLLQQALMNKQPLVRESGSSNSLPMFNDGRNLRMPGMNTNGLHGAKSNLESSGGMSSQMDPQALNAIRRLKELAKDPTLNHESKQAEASKIIKENPKVVQFLKWMQNGKGNQRQSLAQTIGTNDLFSGLQSAGSSQKGGMVNVNYDQQVNSGGMLGHPESSINGGGTVGTGHDFSPSTQLQCPMQPRSPMNNFNESMGGIMGGNDIQKQRMQQQWEIQQQQQMGGINQRLQHAPPNVMCGPQVGGVPTTQYVHGPPIGTGPINQVSASNGYGSPSGMNSPNMNYQQAPNMIVGHNQGQNWAMMRQPGVTKQPAAPPPNYPYRAPNVRLDRGNIRGISPTIGGYPTQSPGQSNDFRQGNQAFMGSCPPIRQNFPPGNPNMMDQYPVRAPNNGFSNAMYGGPNSTQGLENGGIPMSVRLGVGYSNGPHGEAMSYQNGSQGGPIGDYVNMNQMQVSRNGQNIRGSGGGLLVSQGMGSPMGNHEFTLSQQRGMIQPNMARNSSIPCQAVGGRTSIPHTSPMVQQHLVSQGNMNGLSQGNCSPVQRMMHVNASNNGSNGSGFSSSNGLAPPNMTVPDTDVKRFAPAPPPNYFNNQNSPNDGISGPNNCGNFNSNQTSGASQLNPSPQRVQPQQHLGGQVQNSLVSGGNNGDGNNGSFSAHNTKSNGQARAIGNENQHAFGSPSDNSNAAQSQQVSSGWKQNATELRKGLLTRLHQTLQSQGNPNAQAVAESVERDAFTRSGSQEAYTMKLAEWLANVFRQSGGDQPENTGVRTIDEQQQQPGNFQQGIQTQENDVNKEVNPQMQQHPQNQQMTSTSCLPGNDTPSSTLSNSVAADSTTLQEALSRVSTSNISPSECPNNNNSCKPEMENLSSDNTRDTIKKELSVDIGLKNTSNSSLSKTNPILADLLPATLKEASFDNPEPSTIVKGKENEEMKSSDENSNNTSTIITGCGKEINSSVSTPTAGPPSNSSIYNMPSVSPKSGCSSSTSSSVTSCSSSSNITTTSSPQSSNPVEVRSGPASISAHTNTSLPSSKASNSPGMTFSGNQMKNSDNTSSISPGNSSAVTTTTSSSLAFHSSTNFSVPVVDSNENCAKQTTTQASVVSSAANVTSNNNCMTTTAANKGSAMVTAVRRPSGKSMNGQQQSTNQAGQAGNTGIVTGLPALTTSLPGQLPNTNAPPVSGQSNIQPHSVDSGIGSPRSIASSTLYSPKIQGTSPSLNNPNPEILTSSSSPQDKGSS